MSQRPRAIESAVGSGGRPSMGRSPPPGYNGTDACKLFNEQRCFYQRCKFRHICLACGGDHPASGKPECAARTQWIATGGGQARSARTGAGVGGAAANHISGGEEELPVIRPKTVL